MAEIKKTVRISKGDALVIEKGANLIIANQSYTVADVEVMSGDGRPMTIKALVPAKEI